MVAAADTLKAKLHAAGGAGFEVSLTGASGMWSDFNTANRKAMMKSELYSWPVTLVILTLAFGALAAAGLPLMLTVLGLLASAGLLSVLTHGFEISIWAMNFALMFALALGIDYALFMVHRFRAGLFGSKLPARDAVAVTMDTAGKAVLFSGATVLISLSAVMLVPSPAFRSMALGIMISVAFILAATLTLLPAALARLGSVSTPGRSAGCIQASIARSASPAGRSSLAQAASLRPRRGAPPARSRLPGRRPEDGHAFDQGRAPEGRFARRLRTSAAGFWPGSSGRAPDRGAAGTRSGGGRRRRPRSSVARFTPPVRGGGGLALVQAVPRTDPSSGATGLTIDRLRAALPLEALVGGAVAENHDLEAALRAKTPLVIGVVLMLGFLLLLFALRAPLIAALGVATNLLATAAAFGVARVIFQGGHGAGLLGFQSQGFLDAWGPVFFFAMVFAISMDYTVFLLSSAKEHYDRSAIHARR